MITKEVLQARWKVLTFALLALASSVDNIIRFCYTKYLQACGDPSYPLFQELTHDSFMKNYSAFTWHHWFATDGPLIMVLFAAVLGGGLIAEEARTGPIFPLPSKPVRRTRLFLVRYAVSAGLLLAVSVLSSLVLALAGLTLRQPLEVQALLIATGLLWLVALVPLGLALFFSILFSDTLRPVVFSLLVMAGLVLLPIVLPNGGLQGLERYWNEQQAFLMGSFPLMASLICLVAVLVPLLAALLVFRRKAY
ncbi:ABC transporter permease [Ktedonosporobacter rubrisoli]|uniref:ABC transporter permease n=1 Tax=Ktedonosporobacter rubrisoli TaxID=2509675 RepID=A0A4P6JJN4_KTERU|nr:ABC transporter permease [Ktedonosporobacter rubrisoli]QBD75335.1 ABC transporter permease [Ktedonosporobacter rubrisoli]